jgi:hypothetical protein
MGKVNKSNIREVDESTVCNLQNYKNGTNYKNFQAIYSLRYDCNVVRADIPLQPYAITSLTMSKLQY